MGLEEEEEEESGGRDLWEEVGFTSERTNLDLRFAIEGVHLDVSQAAEMGFALRGCHDWCHCDVDLVNGICVVLENVYCGCCCCCCCCCCFLRIVYLLADD